MSERQPDPEKTRRNEDEPDVEGHRFRGPVEGEGVNPRAGRGAGRRGRLARAEPRLRAGDRLKHHPSRSTAAPPTPTQDAPRSHQDDAPNTPSSAEMSAVAAGRRSASMPSRAAASRATEASSPRPSSAPPTRRTASKRSSATAAWPAKRPSRSSSSRLGAARAGPVQDGEHAERALVQQQRRGHDPARHVPRAARHVDREARVLGHVLHDDRARARPAPSRRAPCPSAAAGRSGRGPRRTPPRRRAPPARRRRA